MNAANQLEHRMLLDVCASVTISAATIGDVTLSALVSQRSAGTHP